jgi:hypothetical protein
LGLAAGKADQLLDVPEELLKKQLNKPKSIQIRLSPFCSSSTSSFWPLPAAAVISVGSGVLADGLGVIAGGLGGAIGAPCWAITVSCASQEYGSGVRARCGINGAKPS